MVTHKEHVPKKVHVRKKKVPLDEVDDYLAINDPIVLQTEPEKIAKIGLGKTVLVVLPNHSKQYRAMSRIQFDAKKVKQYGNILLSDGQELTPGKAYDLELNKEIKDLMMKGVLKGGGRPRF